MQWGEQPNKLNNIVKQVVTNTYTASDMCGAPATTIGFRSTGFLHSGLLEGLKPNTQYFYQVGDSTPRSNSSVLNFWSAPDPDTQNAEFVIFGDLGQVETDGSNEASQMPGSILTTLALTADIEYGVVNLTASPAVFHIGDISYARGYASLWEQFFSQISAMTPHLPWMTIDGNHERDWPDSGSSFAGGDSGGECGVALAQRFHMPNPSDALPNDKTWWSLDFGPIHFTIISTEHEFNKTTPQYVWFNEDLAAVNRSKTPFLLVAGHRPMYTDHHSSAEDIGTELIKVLEPLMIKYQVDAAFWGHVHTYERTCPVHNYTCVHENVGVINFVTGAAGGWFLTAATYQAQMD